MTSKTMPSAQPTALTENAAERVQGGKLTPQGPSISSVKDTRPTPTETGFIPSSGTSRMD